MIGATEGAIDKVEDRNHFKEAMAKNGILLYGNFNQGYSGSLKMVKLLLQKVILLKKK